MAKLSNSKAGTYEYELSEVQKVPSEYTADQTKHKVTVEVTDNGKGQLESKVTYDADADKVVFVNTYAAKGRINLTEEKFLTGKTLNEGDYNFVLADADNQILSNKQNDEDGNVTDTWTSTLKDHPVILEAGSYKLSGF